eukprot:1151643-Pelagomonas_calceolata.AAC.4
MVVNLRKALIVICTPGLLDAGLPRCWDGFQGLRKCDEYVQAVHSSAPIKIQGFTDDLRLGLRDVWNTAATNAASVPQNSVSLSEGRLIGYQSY